jgi:pyrroline-5-carboxylate reductase
MKIAIIGCGNMARAMVTQVHALDKDIKFFTYTPGHKRALALAQDTNGEAVVKLSDLPDCDLYLIACKPQQLNELSLNLNGALKNKNIFSVLAATQLSTLTQSLGSENIVRVMPNTPSEIGLGVSLFIPGKNANSQVKIFTKAFLVPCGEIVEVGSEKELDELTVFSGCGPAYLYRFALAYEKKIISMGYDAKLARKLIEQTFLGSAQLMKNSNLEISTLIDNVTSKAGVTIEAVNILDRNNIDGVVDESIEAALRRTEEIAQGS